MSGVLKDYEKLKERGKDLRLLSSVSMLLEWDQETFMPKDGIDFRSSQIELVTSLMHKEKTSTEYKHALEKLIDLESGEVRSDALDGRKKASLREFRSDFLQEAKLPNCLCQKTCKSNLSGCKCLAACQER